MSDKSDAQPYVEIARIPVLSILAVAIFLGSVFGPPALSDDLPALVRLIAASIGVFLFIRLTKPRQTITPQAVIVVSFFRTVIVPLEDVSVAATRPGAGYIEINDGKGRTIPILATPKLGGRSEAIRSELLYRIRIALESGRSRSPWLHPSNVRATLQGRGYGVLLIRDRR